MMAAAITAIGAADYVAHCYHGGDQHLCFRLQIWYNSQDV